MLEDPVGVVVSVGKRGMCVSGNLYQGVGWGFEGEFCYNEALDACGRTWDLRTTIIQHHLLLQRPPKIIHRLRQRRMGIDRILKNLVTQLPQHRRLDDTHDLPTLEPQTCEA